MNPATQLNEITSSLFGWASFQTQWKVDFNSYALKTAEGAMKQTDKTPEERGDNQR